MRYKMFENTEIFTITRSLNAPRELVFSAFTDPEHLVRWWGPTDFKMVYCKLDLRPGGMFHYCARSPKGNLLWGRFVYREISAHRRIIFINSFSDEYANLTPAIFPGWPREMLNKVMFTESEGKTTIVLTSEAINATEDERKNFVASFKHMKNGYNGAFDQLEKHLTGINGMVA